ncbi:MAG: DUF4412 domain-containing protein [Bacteroidales bacterium]|nr:DUF4412 domain-containing protein [Bacteroidales bacterium]
MKIKFLLLTVCAMLIVSLNAEAQIINILKKKKNTEEKTETEDEKIEEKVRKKLGMGALSAIMGGGGADVPHKESYDFNTSINMEILSYENGEADEATVIGYTTYINEKTSDVAIDIKPQSEGGSYEADMTMIYDRDNNTVFMLTRQGERKMAIATPMDEIESMPGDEEDEDYPDEGDETTYTKTGRTKNIHGYKCEEYTIVDEESRSEVWVTHDTDFTTGREEMKEAGIPMYDEGPFEGGMVMEMDVFEDEVKTMSMYVRDIKKNISKSFSLDSYSIMNVGTGGQK